MNSRELSIMLSLGICGEIERGAIKDMFPGYSEYYVRRVARGLVKKNCIRTYTYEADKKCSRANRVTVYRISEPSGIEYINQIGNGYPSHMDITIGKKGSRYKGTARQRERVRRAAKISSMFLECGKKVDMLSNEIDEGISDIALKRLYPQTSERLKPEKVLEKANELNEVYITSKMLFLKARKTTNQNTLMWKAHGIYKTVHTSYIVYFMEMPGEMWKEIVERDVLAVVSSYIIRTGLPQNKGASIFFTRNKGVSEEILLTTIRDKRNRSQINPLKVYNSAHIIPRTENYRDMIEFLSIEDHIGKSSRVVIGADYREGQSYNGLNKERKVYNFLDCDIGRVIYLYRAIKEEGGILIIHKWQEDVFKTIFDNVLLSTYDEEEFKEVVKEVKTL